MTVSIGVAGALGPDVVGELAPEIEAAGFDTLWVNDTSGGNALAALAGAASATDRLRLATGVIPVDRRPAAEVVAEVREFGLPLDRLTIGIGSGAARTGTLGLVRDAVAALRALPGARIAVGALGPRMRRLGAEHADAVVLNWLTPECAREQTAELHATAPGGHAVLYVRTALDPAASARLADEADRYASYPSYAANFARLGIAATDTVIDGQGALRTRIPAFRDAADEVVLRAITPDDTAASYRAFVVAARAVV